MEKINEVIIVEGRYDKNTLSQIVDAVIIETAGFGIFSDKEKLDLIRKIADKRGVIVLTDSDSAGFLIRNYLKGALKSDKIKHAYIPDRFGKERRKRKPSKEGKLGVEGISPELIIQALKNCGASFENSELTLSADKISKTDMYTAGLTGMPESLRKRREFLKKLDLPENLSSNAMLDVLNIIMTKDEFLNITMRQPTNNKSN